MISIGNMRASLVTATCVVRSDIREYHTCTYTSGGIDRFGILARDRWGRLHLMPIRSTTQMTHADEMLWRRLIHNKHIYVGSRFDRLTGIADPVSEIPPIPPTNGN